MAGGALSAGMGAKKFLAPGILQVREVLSVTKRNDTKKRMEQMPYAAIPFL